MSLTIRNCTFDAGKCALSAASLGLYQHALSVVRVIDTSVGCGHCGETIYPDALVISDHTFRCEGLVAIWYSHAMSIEVHRCSQPSAEITTDQLLELAFDAVLASGIPTARRS